MRIPTTLLLTTLALGSQAALAQQPLAAEKSVVSAPGTYAASAVVEITATVTGVDKATRTIHLKGSNGKTVDIVAGDDVKNFDQIHVDDTLTVRYREALTLDLKNVRGTPGATEKVVGARAAPGQRPAGTIGREVVVLADVVAVDPVKSLITVKGPGGRVVDLKVQNPEHFKVVKVGDQVEAVYTEAVAIAVKPANAGAAK